MFRFWPILTVRNFLFLTTVDAKSSQHNVKNEIFGGVWLELVFLKRHHVLSMSKGQGVQPDWGTLG